MPIFRKGTQEDINQIANLEKNIFSDAWTVKSLQDTFEQKQAFVTVAELEGKVVGYCIIYYVMEVGEIARIAVGEKVRRHGVGRKLLDYTCQCCRDKKMERLFLEVRESNMGARAFYEKYGFAEDGIRKNYYEHPKEHAILMSMLLE